MAWSARLQRQACSWWMKLLLVVIVVSVPAACLADGPPDPEFDPLVLAKKPAFNIHVGGPNDDWLTGARNFGEVHYYYGKGGKDLLDTQMGNDIIFGGEGDDGLYGEDGNDTILGGPGNDYLIGAPGRDILYGEDGDDTLDGDPCGIGNTCLGPRISYDDWLSGGPGNDNMIGRYGNDELYGGPGNDVMDGQEDDDYVNGGDGDDTVAGGDGNDYLDGGPGNDRVFAGMGLDVLVGGPGNDVLHGGGGTNIFVVDAQPCGDTDSIRYFFPPNGDKVIVVAGGGTRGAAILAGGVKSLVVKTVAHVTGIYVPGCAIPIATFMGIDVPVAPIVSVLSLQQKPPPVPSWVVGAIPPPVPGRGGVPPIPPDNIYQGTEFGDKIVADKTSKVSAYIWGLRLDDTLVGGPGDDYIIGGGHNDNIKGGPGDDRLSGGDGYDVIWGEGGRDALFGGHNIDVLYGGGLGNWITGGDSIDYIYVDAPPSCSGFAFPDVINDYGGDKLFIVGSLTSLSQLSIGTSGADGTISLAGCSRPFIVLKGATNIITSRIGFVRPGNVPNTPMRS